MDGAFGYYGKIPAQGDFLRGGLSPDFISPWDAWVQSLLVQGREALAVAWQDAYFSAPIWRFALPPGACGAHAMVGIMMPSVDRVGRQFPLTLACETAATTSWAAYGSASACFETLEDTALAMLEDTATTTDLSERLAAVKLGAIQAAPSTATCGSAMSICGVNQSEGSLIAAGLLSSYGHSPCLWVAAIEGSHRVLITPGLPIGQEEARAMMDSSTPNWSCSPTVPDAEALI